LLLFLLNRFNSRFKYLPAVGAADYSRDSTAGRDFKSIEKLLSDSAVA
jgi:hypothetical protein